MSTLGCASPKIAKLIPRLASDYDGEVIATVRAIARTLYGAGKDFHDLACAVQQETAPANAAPPAEPQNWSELCLFCLAFLQLLTAREFAFCAISLRGWLSGASQR
jgi:hypothetical protein